MASRTPRPALFLPLVLLAAGLAQLAEGASEQQFQRQHIDFPRSSMIFNQGYCDRLMQSRGLTVPHCKATNIFIHAPAARVHAICTNAGTRVHGKVYESIAPFHLTVCQLVSSIRGRCRYRATVKHSRIRVTCG